MFDLAVAGLGHALDLSAFSALGQPLDRTAEVTEGSVLLLPTALVTLHYRVAGKLHDVSLSSYNFI